MIVQEKNEEILDGYNGYENLRTHLNTMPVGFPSTESGIEIKILKHLFTPEEARIALALKFLGEPVKNIHNRLKKSGFSLEDVENKLDEMYFKGLIFRVTDKLMAINYYSSAPFIIGMYEFQLNDLTPEFFKDSEQYLHETYVRHEYNKTGIPQLRVIPVDQVVGHDQKIATYDDVKQLIDNIGEPIAVMDCICRKGAKLVGDPCKKTDLDEACLTFRRGAESFIEKGLAREITKEEAFKILEKAKEDGLVLQPGNALRPISICICCGCCCGVLGSQKMLPKVSQLFATNFRAEVDSNSCLGCGTCESRCNLEAVHVKNDIARVDKETCIGCGVCVTKCSSGAMTLVKKEKEIIPPKNTMELYTKIMEKKVDLSQIKAICD